ncbi:MAG: glycosyltransferase family 4 protein [Bacteroidetes bacterium]|nr:glycosyltransferase family 4 protein [Bacteroidota bacterium]
MKKNLKILFIPRWYPDRNDPLKGIFIRRHALSVALKHKVAVLFVNADPEMKNKIYDSEFSVEDGISTARVYYNNSAPSFIKFFRYLKSCRLGIKIIKEKFGTPDISHIHVLARTFFIAYYYKMFNNTPYIITEQWSGYLPEDGSYKGFLKKWLTKLAVRKADGVTVVSKSLRDAMITYKLNNVYHIIPNVVDINQFHPAPEKKLKEKFTLLTVADMDDRAKNISGTIRVIKKISFLRNDFEYHIIGDGADMKEMEKLAVENKLLNNFIFFHGAKKSSEVAEAMRNADAFILFSNYDNMPSVMTESLASGLPVIGSAIHGMMEHINNELGILVPPCDENALCDAIQAVLKKTKMFNADYLREYAMNNFSYNAVSEKFDNVYKEVIL